MKKIKFNSFRSAFFGLSLAGLGTIPGQASEFFLREPTPEDIAVRLEVGGGYSLFDVDPGASSDGANVEGSGSAAVSFGSLNAQIDLFGAHDDPDIAGTDLNFFAVVGHLNIRNSNLGYFGIAASYNLIENDLTEDFDVARVGFEGEAFLDDLSIGIATGFLDFDGEEAFYIQGRSRYYVLDDLKLEGAIGLADAEIVSDAEPSIFFSHALAEYRIPNDFLPASVFLRWNGAFGDDFLQEADSHQILAGFRIFLGQQQGFSLKQYDRTFFADTCLFQASTVNIC